MNKKAIIYILALVAITAIVVAITAPPSTRRDFWTPGTYTGYTGGVPTNRTMTCNIKVSIPGTNIVAVGDGVADDYGALMAAFKYATATTNGYIYFPAGTYRFTTNLSIVGVSGVTDCNYFTLKGEGTNSLLYFDPDGALGAQGKLLTIGGSKWRDSAFNAVGGNFTSYPADIPAGTYSLTLSAIPANMLNGGMITIDELNDWNVVTSTNYTSAKSTAYNTDGDGLRNHTYTALITNITGNTVMFTPPTPIHGFSAANSPRVFSMNNLSGGGTRLQYKGIGLDSLSFALNTNNPNCVASGQNWTIKFDGCSDFYVQNCYFADVSRFYIYPSACINGTIRSNFLGRQFGIAQVDVAYGMDVRGCSNFQIENNIFYQMYIPLILANCSRFYIGYNFFYDILTQGGSGTQGSEINCNHGAHNYAHLIEGNYCGRIQADRTHGSSGNITIYGNMVTGTGKTVTQNRYAISLDSASWSNVVIGNVLGYSGMQSNIFMPTNNSFSTASNVILRLGYPFIGNNFIDDVTPGNVTNRDLTVTNTLLYHANYDYAGNTYRYDPNYDNGIANSLVYNSRPSWYGGFGWPPYGPNGYGGNISNLIPAMARFYGYSDPGFGLGTSRPGLMPLY
jgi:polygalacturonase